MKKVVFKIFIFLIVAELTFRIIGFILNYPSLKNNLIQSTDSGKIKILALGESTTADSFAKGINKSWPIQLETLLNQKGLKARVYNEGVSGTNSAFILSRIDSLLQKYHPDIVISMVGVNDALGVPFYYSEDAASSSINLFFTNLRLFKLYKWTKNSLLDWRYSKTLNGETLPDELDKWTKAQTDFARTNGLSKTESMFAKSIHDRNTLSLALMRTGVNLIGNMEPENSSKLSFSFFKRAYEIYPNNYFNLFWILRESITVDPNYCQHVSREATAFGTNLPDGILFMMAKCLADDNHSGFLSLLKSRNLNFGKNITNYTSYHYFHIHKKIIASGAKHLAMQYPTLPISQLKQLLPDDQNIIYIENNDNFRLALKTKEYNEVFEDNFAGMWGHATAFGNYLIAKNLENHILKIIKNSK